MLDETFATPMTTAEKLRLIRWIAAATAAVAVVSGLLLLWWQSPVWKTWLFDLSIATVFAAATYMAGRRLIAAEVRHRRRVEAAILVGIAGASAALGVYAITLLGPPEGLERLPGLVVIQLLGAAGGMTLGFVTGFVATALVRFCSRFFACSKPSLDGAVIGAISGIVGGSLFLEFPHLGWWFVAASAALCSLCASRAAANFAELCPPSQPAD
jgi:hypothetical protein